MRDDVGTNIRLVKGDTISMAHLEFISGFRPQGLEVLGAYTIRTVAKQTENKMDNDMETEFM